jgi:NNP family nitrate/nitrite transporter-like MFS transporter
MGHTTRKLHQPSTKGIRANLSTILLLISVVFSVFIARVIYSPLLPSIERELHLSHTEAASFFLLITLGYAVMNVFSGFFASRVGHRSTILISALVVSSATVIIAVSSSLLLMRAGLILVGAGAGLYPPSGIATISSLVESKDEGKILSLHEYGQNLGFILAPLIVALLIPRVNWRICLLLVSLLGLSTGVLFMILGRGGGFRGEPPVLRNLSRILKLPSFWIGAALLALGIGASIGLYSIIPTYLVFERGMNADLVNTIVGISRISGLVILLFAGYLIDRFGARWVITVILFSTGLVTAALWTRSQVILIGAVFL